MVVVDGLAVVVVVKEDVNEDVLMDAVAEVVDDVVMADLGEKVPSLTKLKDLSVVDRVVLFSSLQPPKKGSNDRLLKSQNRNSPLNLSNWQEPEVELLALVLILKFLLTTTLLELFLEKLLQPLQGEVPMDL